MVRTDSSRIETCSDSVQNGINYLEDRLSRSEEMPLSLSISYYVLNRVKPCINSGNIDSIQSNVYDFNTLIYEGPIDFVFLAKLANEVEGYSLTENQQLQRAVDLYRGLQMNKGKFSISDYPESAPLLLLYYWGSPPSAIQRTVNYIIKNYPEEARHHTFGLANEALCVIALHEIDSAMYADSIEQIARSIESRVEIEEEDISDSTIRFSVIAVALLVSPHNSPLVGKIIEELRSAQLDNGSWEDSPYNTGYVLWCLLHNGEGPKVAKMELEEKIQSKEQELQRSRAQFISTKPATRHENREISIYNKTADLIQNAEQVLRISTLRIDLFHEDLADKIEGDSDFELKILTNKGKSNGPRSKLKKAAMDDLVRRTEGNVIEDELIHSRMIISDDQELIVSSADVTRDQLKEEYNSGIYTQDERAIEKAIQLFENAWEGGNHRSA